MFINKANHAGSNVIWTAMDAAQATGGQTAGQWAATGLSIDTRTLQPGDLYIALKGDRVDGHAYVADALAKGAVAAMVHAVPPGLENDGRLLIVPDTFTALQDLGRASRHRSGAKVIAVTGSVGKTGTKEMLAAAFGAQGQTHASEKSFNNHWGVPFSLASMHAGSDFGIFEIGMNHAEEITPLSQMAQPDIAIITTVEAVHLEHFGTVEKIADAKAEIFAGMSHGGVAILNHDNPHFARLSAAAKTHGLKVLSFGEHADADARLEECLLATNGSLVKANVMGQEIRFTLKNAGAHIATNALSVLLSIKAAGANVEKGARALEKIEPLAGRGKRESIIVGDPANPITLFDDSYNASPVAMKAAFRVLATVDPGRGGRRIAFLGDMRELGADGPAMHAELALPLEAAGIKLVYTSGPLMKTLRDALPVELRGVHDDDPVALARIVPDVLVPGDVVLVKGSRGGGEKPRMQPIVEAVRQMSTIKLKGPSNAI
jgi:UDP-N-acetylmuramoyl-tripeptide--D-alanyl-D-alanine ligase